MSEAILYAIDAPHITDVMMASEFVDQCRDSDEAPTAGIASFFENLLSVTHNISFLCRNKNLRNILP